MYVLTVDKLTVNLLKQTCSTIIRSKHNKILFTHYHVQCNEVYLTLCKRQLLHLQNICGFLYVFFQSVIFLHPNLSHHTNGRRESIQYECTWIKLHIASHCLTFCKGKYSLRRTESFLPKSKGEIEIDLKLKAWQHIEEKEETGITVKVGTDSV